MLLTNGRIHVLDAALSIVDTVVVSDGRIAFAGRRADNSAGDAYAWRSLLDTGTIILGGSSFPVEDRVTSRAVK